MLQESNVQNVKDCPSFCQVPMGWILLNETRQPGNSPSKPFVVQKKSEKKPSIPYNPTPPSPSKAHFSHPCGCSSANSMDRIFLPQWEPGDCGVWATRGATLHDMQRLQLREPLGRRIFGPIYGLYMVSNICDVLELLGMMIIQIESNWVLYTICICIHISTYIYICITYAYKCSYTCIHIHADVTSPMP